MTAAAHTKPAARADTRPETPQASQPVSTARLKFLLVLLVHFITARWLLRLRSRRLLQCWQAYQLHRMVRQLLPRAPFYAQALREQVQAYEAAPPPRSGAVDWAWLARSQRRWARLPIIDKAVLMAEFDRLNTRGVARDQALAVAEQAEVSRDFTPTLGAVKPAWADLSVGLSSGTSGQRGLFVVSDAERARWAGVLLGRTLPSAMLRQIITPWRPPLRLAFFLRANNNLYTTLASRRIDFQFFDLLQGLPAAMARLHGQAPDVLIAPPAALHQLAQAQLRGDLGWPRTQPLRHLVAVADVLEPADSALCEQAFGLRPAQIYQATEGFLGYTCERGGLHLNETYLLIEQAGVDQPDSARAAPENAARSETTDAEQPSERFQPIITDLSRSTQLIVRYRLNDILRIAPEPCRCGRAELTLAAIEGRCDDWLHIDGTAVAADVFRRAVSMAEHGWALNGFAEHGLARNDPPQNIPAQHHKAPIPLAAATALRDYRFIQHNDTGALILALDAADAQIPAWHAAISTCLRKLLAQQGLTMPELGCQVLTDYPPEPAHLKRRRVQRLATAAHHQPIMR